MRNNVWGLVGPATYGPAYPSWVDVTTPAAGANASTTVDGRWTERLIGARCTFTPDNNAANRLVTLDYVDPKGTVRLRNGAGVVFAATSGAQAFEFDAHRTVAEWATNTPVFVPLAPWFLPSGWTYRFTADNIQVGDTFTLLSVWTERFQTGRGGYQLGVVPEPEETPGQLLTSHPASAYAKLGD